MMNTQFNAGLLMDSDAPEITGRNLEQCIPATTKKLGGSVVRKVCVFIFSLTS
jgi:hypothetical protein